MNYGWIKLDRKIFDHWLWEDKPFSRGQAWIDLVMQMNHKDEKMVVEGEVMVVKRGSKVTSMKKLSERWGWSVSKVTRFLKMLESDGMINKKCDTKKTVVTVANYGFYQSERNANETLKERQKNSSETPAIHQRNANDTPAKRQRNANEKPSYYNKECKEKKEKKNTPAGGIFFDPSVCEKSEPEASGDFWGIGSKL